MYDSNRMYYLDVLKAYAIMLVIYCHFPFLSSQSVVGNLFMLLAWSGVPVFFMVSGYLWQRKEQKNEKIKKAVIKIYFQILLWKIVYFLVYSSISSNLTINYYELFNYLFLFDSYPGINTDVMWYMQAYMCILLLYPLFNYANGSEKGRKAIDYMLMLCFVFGIVIPSIQLFINGVFRNTGALIAIVSISNINPLAKWPNMFFYFLFGNRLAEKYENDWRKWFGMIVFGVLGLVLDKYLQSGTLAFVNRELLSSGYNRLSTVLLSSGIFLMFKSCESSFQKCFFRVSYYLGQHTLGIYYLHYLMLGVLYDKVSIGQSFISNVCKTIVVMLACDVITIIMKKTPIARFLVS